MKSHAVMNHPAAAAAGLLSWKKQAGCLRSQVALLIALAAPVLAQQRPLPPADRTNAERAQQQEMTRREIKLRNVGEPAAKSSDPKRLQALMDQLDEDVKRILTLHNEIVRATAADKTLDYNFVSDAAAEIRKRASRLQGTLAMKTESVDQNHQRRIKYADSQVKDALIALCKHIESFIANPVIESPGTVDLVQSGRAGSDLSDIVELSGNIRKSAERLNKTPR